MQFEVDRQTTYVLMYLCRQFFYFWLAAFSRVFYFWTEGTLCNNQSHYIEVTQGGVSNSNTQLIVILALFESGVLCFRGKKFFLNFLCPPKTWKPPLSPLFHKNVSLRNFYMMTLVVSILNLKLSIYKILSFTLW